MELTRREAMKRGAGVAAGAGIAGAAILPLSDEDTGLLNLVVEFHSLDKQASDAAEREQAIYDAIPAEMKPSYEVVVEPCEWFPSTSKRATTEAEINELIDGRIKAFRKKEPEQIRFWIFWGALPFDVPRKKLAGKDVEEMRAWLLGQYEGLRQKALTELRRVHEVRRRAERESGYIAAGVVADRLWDDRCRALEGIISTPAQGARGYAAKMRLVQWLNNTAYEQDTAERLLASVLSDAEVA